MQDEYAVPKKDMTEEDIKHHFITPAIEAKWNKKKISMETRITDGRINLRGNLVHRDDPKRVDYLLYLADNRPIAVVEAKDNKHAPSYGLQQAIEYAEMLDIPFAYSSNGDAFVERDILNGAERTIALTDFPTEDELIARWRTAQNDGKGPTPAQERILRQPYYTAVNTNTPRYYQQIAVNRTVEAIAGGRDRILLVMATGTGKTYTAFQIVYRLLKSGIKRKILYLADRNILVDQSIQQDFAPLQNVTHKINVSKDSKNSAALKAYEIYFALYQQLVGDDGKEHFRDLFAPDFFDLIIVDECHRGSVDEESIWRRILEYFRGAAQIGMTATPKETKYLSNIDYFGAPLYKYSLQQGIRDGFLAPFKVINVKTNIGDGWRPRKGQRDIYGNEIEDRIYTNDEYDYTIILEDRIREIAAEITRYLKSTDRMAKTIVFCAGEDAALRMRDALVRENADMVQKYPDYVVRITGSDTVGKDKLDYFIAVNAKTPVIATTSKLLSTGVDCKMTKLIVLDQRITSMTEFKQIIGRGTRLRADEGKTHFVVMDLRGVTRLFADPAWDGPIEQDEDYGKPTDTHEGGEDGGSCKEPEPPTYGIDITEPRTKPIVNREGQSVVVTHKTVAIYDIDGKLLRQENIIDYTKESIYGEYDSLDTFIHRWTGEKKKETIRALLRGQGIDLEAIKQEHGMANVDDFDFICHVAYDQKPLTRKERADGVKKRDFFAKYSGAARKVLETLLEKYSENGIYELETFDILKLDAFQEHGRPSKIVGYFGGKDGYLTALRALEEAIYAEQAV